MSGDCFRAAGSLAVELGDAVTLCHGLPIYRGQPAADGTVAGDRYDHAWVETVDGTRVLEFSNGRRHVYDRGTYYLAGNIDERWVVRFTWHEAIEQMQTTGHWGPWERVTA